MKKILSIIVCISLLSFNLSTYSLAASYAKVYYNASLSVGMTSHIKTKLTSMGYTSTRTTIPSKTTLRNAFGSNSIIFVLSHGSPGSIKISDESRLTANEVDNYYYNSGRTSSAQLVFLQCCYCGSSSSTNGNYPSVFSRAGVRSSITFSDAITATKGSSTDGIHYFSYMFFCNLKEGNTIRNSVLLARAELLRQTGKSWGSDSAVVKGGGYTIP